MQTGMKIDSKTPECRKFLSKLMDQLEAVSIIYCFPLNRFTMLLSFLSKLLQILSFLCHQSFMQLFSMQTFYI